MIIIIIYINYRINTKYDLVYIIYCETVNNITYDVDMIIFNI